MNPAAAAILFVGAIWLNYKLSTLHLPRLLALVVVLLPFVHTLAGDALKGPVRVRSLRGDRLEFWFANHEYARLFELQNPCVTENSELARVL